MVIDRTIFIPENRRIVIEVPKEIPTGAAAGIKLTWPVRIDAVKPAAQKRLPVSRFFNIIRAETYGSGVVYQRRLRDEWNE
jgi:hypothetical protein